MTARMTNDHALSVGLRSRRCLVTPERVEKYDLDTCPNGPDEYGDYPCDPKVLFGGGYAECQVCGRVAAWGRDTTKAWAKG